MRQVIQSFRSGQLRVKDVPHPTVRAGQVLVANVRSLISAGTEKSTVTVAKKSLVGKAIERPDLVQKVLGMARKEGVFETLRTAFQRLDSPVQLGYSCAGVVIDVGAGVQGIAVGDRVACAGQNYASHAEVVSVPRNLCVPIPEGVNFDQAAYVTLGAIALQGVRQADPRLGEVIAVIGLGLLGQLTVQMLKANGCRVLASDISDDKLQLAKSFGADDFVLPANLESAAAALTGGRGVDAVIIAASTKDNAPIEAAATIARRKGRVVVVGAVNMDVPREPFYQKELELRLSTSYGPGRYDPEYEEKGHDYPYGYVRWTEARNMEAFLWLVREAKVNLVQLTTHQFPIEEAEAAYKIILEGSEPYLGIVLSYPLQPASRAQCASTMVIEPRSGKVAVGIIGAGHHIRDMILPQLKRAEFVDLQWVCTATGASADAAGDKYGIGLRTTDYSQILKDSAVDAVVIGTRHDSHARIVTEALLAGKSVFVEKPLCLSEQELSEIDAANERAAGRGQVLRVGFNRRYSSHAERIRDFFAHRREPLVMAYRVNAGPMPPEHWIQDPTVGGGRIVGEGCHFIDLMLYVCGSLPTSVVSTSVRHHSSRITEDHSVITIGFADGSIGTLIYAAGGDKTLPKERCEFFGAGMSAVLDDFVTTTFFKGGRVSRFKSRGRDKGFAQEMQSFVQELMGSETVSMPFDQIVAVSRTAILAARSLQTGERYEV